jgi:hypothetical protein
MLVKVKWEKVLHYEDLDQKPLIDWIDLGNATQFRIFAFFSHGGFRRPREGLMIGIERIGSYFFRLDNKIYTDYVCEKLNLTLADAANIADWLNVQIGYEVPQQGKYTKEYIESVKPYWIAGERSLMPLRPEIIK